MPAEDEVFEIIRQEWREAAATLADWAMTHLVNRKDVWGQYTGLSEKEKLNSKRGYKALTLPQKSMRGKDMVTLDKLTRHFRSTAVNHLIGLHSARPDNTSRWLALDIDLHDPEAVDAEDEGRRNFAAALGWWEEVQALGYDPLLLDSNGAGGYHLLILFQEPAPTADVHALGQRLLASWKQKNVDGPPEQFPKSAEVTGDKLGAWLRVFGMHHTRKHFTKVWSGDAWLDEPWLEGSAAVDAILGARPGPPPPTATEDAEVVVAKGKKSRKKAFTAERKKKPRVCLDLDGVLARYDGWQGKDVIGDPISGSLEFVRSLGEVAELVIFTSRVDILSDRAAIEHWLAKHGFPELEVHAGSGKPKAIAYIDDRAISCLPQDLGPAAYASAEQALRALMKQRDPEQEEASEGMLGRVVAEWDRLSEAQRKAILKVME